MISTLNWMTGPTGSTRPSPSKGGETSDQAKSGPLKDARSGANRLCNWTETFEDRYFMLFYPFEC